jgi:hypothetical protein
MANESLPPGSKAPMSHEDLKCLANQLCKVIDLLEAREVSEKELRNRVADLPPNEALACNAWIDLVVALDEASRRVEEPAYRKGTGMKRVAWSDCLWRPPQ